MGIDVSMCCHYWAGTCEEGGITKKCSERSCYYKQLQQLEATLDEIKEMCKLSLHCDNCHEILQKIKEVKQ